MSNEQESKEVQQQDINNSEKKNLESREISLSNIGTYTIKNGNKIDLSGVNLEKEENQKILSELITSNPLVTEVDLSGCSLEKFPIELSTLKHLSTLDLRNNRFINFESLVQNLLSLNNLKDLKIDLIDQNQVLMILSQLTKLIFLNGKSTKDAVTVVDIEEKDIEDISLQTDLKDYNDIINQINEKEGEENFVNDFQNKLYEGAEKIKNCLNNNVPNYIYANVVIQIQLELNKYLSEKFSSFLDEKNKKIGKIIFENLFRAGERLVEIINILYSKIDEKTEGLRSQLEEAWKNAEELGEYENKYTDMKKLKEVLSAENDILKLRIKKLENENKMIYDKLFKFNNNFDLASNSSNAKSKINNYNNESKHLSNVDSKLNLKNDSNILNSSLENILNKKSLNSPSASINQNLFKNDSKSDMNIMNPKVLTIKMTKDIMNEIYNSKKIYDKKCYDNKIARETLEQHMYTYLNQKYGLKNLTIEWASSIINAIKMYSNEDCDINLFGKILRNEQEEDSRLILENLKKNVLDILEYYIRSKNPFKNKIEIDKIVESKKEGFLNEEEWKGIINYIYSPEESKIIEEKILSVIEKQRDKISGPISMYIQTGMGPTEIFNGTNILNNLSTMGNQSTPNLNLNNSMNNFNNLNNSYSGPNSMKYLGKNRKLSREELFNLSKLKDELNIKYTEFLKILCVHQIKNRDKYLENFVKLFKKYDTDNDGILNENEFISLIKDIPYCQNNVEEYVYKFLTIIDPLNNKRVTFSECISLFSMENVEEIEDNKEDKVKIDNENNIENNNFNQNKQVSLLDKICLEN